MSRRTIIYYILWVTIIIALGFGIVGFFTMGVEKVSGTISQKTSGLGDYVRSLNTDATTSKEQTSLESDTQPFEIKLGNVADAEFTPPAKGKVIRANLQTMVMRLYEDGNLIDTLPIINKGKPGSYWETPGGTFQLSYKETNHFSTFGNVWMPNSIHFFGNFFIHGEPYDSTGKKFTSLYSGGCIRLADVNAKRVFDWADSSTIVSIYSDSDVLPQRRADNSAYFIRDPQKQLSLSARAYTVGDLDTGEIILEKDGTKQYPIASVSKLITSLVSLDFLKQHDDAVVTKTALSAYGTSGSLRAGEKLSVSTLLYPLILESSNDAAEVLAEHSGRSEFIQNMNEKVKTISMTQTHFKDPSGLSPENVSTSEDLLRLASHIREYKNYVFDISKLSKKLIEGHTWYNNSKLTNAVGYLGGKSGYTPEAENTIVATFSVPLSELGSRNIGITFLQSRDRLGDVKKILAYLKDNVYYSARDRAEAVAATTQSGFQIPLPPPVTEEVTLGFAGDIMLDRGVKDSVMNNFGGDYNKLFANLDFFRDYDIMFANLEGPVSNVGIDKQNLYSFRMNPSVITTLAGAGFDALSVANNHINDWGHDAFDDTIRRLTTSNIVPVGSGTNKTDAEKPKIIEHNGLKIGFLGFTDVGPDELAATENDSGVLLASDPRLPDIIKNASTQVDDLVVSFHWGVEYKQATDRQRELAHLAIDSGARLVIGTHPHVVQETESYKDGYIAYSLGNLIFDQGFSKDTMQGMLLEVTLKKNEINQVNKRIIKLNSKFQPDKIIDLD